MHHHRHLLVVIAKPMSLFGIVLLAVAAAWPFWSSRKKLSSSLVWVLALLTVTGTVLSFAVRAEPIVWLLVGLPTLAFALLLALAIGNQLLVPVFPPTAERELRVSDEVRKGYQDTAKHHGLAQTLVLIIGALGIKAGLLLIALPIAAIFAGLSWTAATRQLGLLRQTRTVAIGEAKPGLVEVAGRVCPEGEKPLKTPVRGIPCVWYRYRVDERHGWNWRTREQGRDGDGSIDAAEWQQAQASARAELAKAHAQRQAEPPVRVLRAPPQAIFLIALGGETAATEAMVKSANRRLVWLGMLLALALLAIGFDLGGGRIR
jgi:hypothetical protein